MKAGSSRSLLMLTLLVLAFPAAAETDCKEVRGRITSQLVSPPATFSNGDPCTSPLGLCTEGRFTGPLKGRFRFVAETLTPFAALGAAAPLDVAATTGTLELTTRYCHGTLVLLDNSAFSLSADGSVGGIETVDGAASTGGCADASGRLRIEGVFMEGCVDCRYEGEICAVGRGGRDED